MPLPSPLSGTVDNFPSGTELWYVTRAKGERNYHPSDTACKMNGTKFDCGTLYLGQAGDAGKAFTVTFIEVPSGSATEQHYVDYGHRNKHTKTTYAGISALYDGTVQVSSVPVIRA